MMLYFENKEHYITKDHRIVTSVSGISSCRTRMN